MSIKLNFIEKFKNKKLKRRKNKQRKKRKKSEKKCYFYKKEKHFVKNCRSNNVMNRRKLNVLRKILVKKKFQKNFESESNSSKIITNDEYYRIKNIDESQQNLKNIILNEALIIMKKINKDVQSTSYYRSKTSYSSHRETQFDNECKYDEDFEKQLIEVANAFERTLGNDAIKEEVISKDIIKKWKQKTKKMLNTFEEKLLLHLKKSEKELQQIANDTLQHYQVWRRSTIQNQWERIEKFIHEHFASLDHCHAHCENNVPIKYRIMSRELMNMLDKYMRMLQDKETKNINNFWFAWHLIITKYQSLYEQYDDVKF